MGQSVGRAFNIADWVFPLVTPSYNGQHRLLVHISSEADVNVPAMLLAPAVPRHELGALVSYCVVYFHANACDIGQCVEDMTTFRDGALDGDAVILCPEFPGYGLLQGYEPSVAAIDIVADAAWRYCVEDMGFEPEQVILWGRSIGTGPATSLAHRVASEAWRRKLQEQGDSDGEAGEFKQPAPFLSPLGPPRCIGGLVLLAPFSSVSAVVEHHVPSRLVASVVGPMWNNLEFVQDSCMEEVPICVVHPKADEVVPSSQGLSVYEKAVSREKFGVWLCHASHNLYILPEHLVITRRFLGKVMRPVLHRAKRRWPREPQASGEAFPLLDASGDVDAEECMWVADQLMQLGSTRKIEEGVWLTL
mmetsp:Transcript_85431/g.226877  ORF Transcript_85431/g.226877 Transcript_85431/m.226877 type:complete len:362 (-) Transcript_85431:71-1156(-)